jgi:hypothetical protein
LILFGYFLVLCYVGDTFGVLFGAPDFDWILFSYFFALFYSFGILFLVLGYFWDTFGVLLGNRFMGELLRDTFGILRRGVNIATILF